MAAISSLGQDMRVVGCMVASGSLEHDVRVGDWFVISLRLLEIKKFSNYSSRCCFVHLDAKNHANYS